MEGPNNCDANAMCILTHKAALHVPAMMGLLEME